MGDEVRKTILKQHGVENFRKVLDHLEEIEQLKLEGFKLNKIAEHFGLEPGKFYAALRKARRINAKMNLSGQLPRTLANGKPLKNDKGDRKSESIGNSPPQKRFTREDVQKMTPQEKVVLFDQTDDELAEFNLDLSNL